VQREDVIESFDAQTVRLPPHVVYRAFAKETVILNLQTGKYHGVNPTGGRMLELLTRTATVGEVADKLAAEYGVSREQIDVDLREFCRDLVERGLIELEVAGGGG
jgi:Coenzyme PQQ synthesis protein D (PqqD)